MLRAGFVAWALVELTSGNVGNALALLAMFAVTLVPRVLRLPVGLDLAVIGAWVLQALGQVGGFWSRIEWWDTLVHVALPAALAPTALLVLIRAGVLPDLTRADLPRRRLGTFIVCFLIAPGFGAGYEVYEWLSDKYLDTTYQPSNDDTMEDTTANVVGGLIGAAGLALLSRPRPEEDTGEHRRV